MLSQQPPLRQTDKSNPRGVTIFIASNAVSGDLQGAYLANKIFEIDPTVNLLGSGGHRMQEAGVNVVVQTDHLGCVGWLAALRFMGKIRQSFIDQTRVIAAVRPDLAILIDNEGYYSECLARFLRRKGIPIVYYFPPLVWLWGAGRAKRVVRKAKAIIAGFPNEVGIFRKAGGRVFYFGHPLVDILAKTSELEGIRASLNLDPEARLVGLMPGSRVHEIEFLAPVMLGAAREMQRRCPELAFLLPVAAPHLKPLLEKQIKAEGMEGRISLVEKDSYAHLKQCDLVIVAAGTATIELSLLGVPMVVVYRLGTLTYAIAKRLIKTEFIAMPNILTGRRIVPELRQTEVTVERVCAEALSILEKPEVASGIKAGLDDVREILGSKNVLEKVAEFILAQAHEQVAEVKVPIAEAIHLKPL